jgi:hypothetical protein
MPCLWELFINFSKAYQCPLSFFNAENNIKRGRLKSRDGLVWFEYLCRFFIIYIILSAYSTLIVSFVSAPASRFLFLSLSPKV